MPLELDERPAYETGDLVPEDGTYVDADGSQVQEYKAGETFGCCPAGDVTQWQRIYH